MSLKRFAKEFSKELFQGLVILLFILILGFVVFALPGLSNENNQIEAFRRDNPMPSPKIWLPKCYSTSDCYQRKLKLEAEIERAKQEARNRRNAP